MRNRTFQSLRAALVAVALIPATVYAVGLGRLTVFSGLGQPLKTEIEVVSLEPGEVESLSARIAPTELFEQEKIDVAPILNSVRVAIDRRGGNRAFVTLTSFQPVNDPYLDILVELSWGGGRLVRRYTFLLDPPQLKSAEPLTVPPITSGAVQMAPAPAVVPAPALPTAATGAAAQPAEAAQTQPQAQAPVPAQAQATQPAAAQPVEAVQPQQPPATQPPAPQTAVAAVPAEPAPAAAPPQAIAEPAQAAAAQAGPQAQPEPLQATPAGPQAPVPVVGAVGEAQPPAAEPKPVAPVAPLEAKPAPETTPVREPEQAYTVKRGDTLSKVAGQYKAQDVTLEQMLVALYRANEHAFVANDMNRMRTGAILTIPDRAAAQSVMPENASRIVMSQWARFNEYRSRLAATVAASSAKPEGSQQAAAGKITARTDETAKSDAGKDQLRLSRADAAKGAGAATSRQDDLAARDKALKDANERLALLEKNVGELSKLLEMKNQQLAQLQKQAGKPGAAPKAGAKATEPAAAAAPAAKGAVEAQKAAPGSKAPAATAKAEAKATEAPKAPAAPAEAAKSPAAKAPPATKAAPVAKAAPPTPAAEPDLLDSVFGLFEGFDLAAAIDDPLGNPIALGAGALLLALLGYGGIVLARKRQSAKQGNSQLGAATTDASSVFGSSGGRNVDTGSSLQTDFSHSAIGAIDTDEVDPIAEADVYMAYGRDAQAEEILREALARDPGRLPVRAKLLEVYASRKDLRAFEATADELQAASGGAGAEWEKAMALGRQVDPSNPRYSGAGAPAMRRAEAVAMPVPDINLAGATVAPAALDFDIEIPSPTTGGTPPAAVPDIPLGGATEPPASLDFDINPASAPAAPVADLVLDGAPTVAPPDLEFNLDLPADKPADAPIDFTTQGTLIVDAATKSALKEAQAAQPPQTDMGLSIDFDLAGAAAPASAPTRTLAPEPVAPGPDTNMMTFDFNLDATPAATPEFVIEPASVAPSLDTASAISFDLDVGQVAPSPTLTSMPSEPVETISLDLASGPVSVAPETPTAESTLDFASIDLDLGGGGNGEASTSAAGDPRWQEVATKLDLAKAYEDMGDKDGARELLHEVVQDGDAAQKQRARGMLEALG